MRYGTVIRAALLFLILLTVAGCATIAGVNEEPQAPPPFPTFPYDKYVQGRPELDPRSQGGFYLWKEGNQWHVRVAEKFERLAGPTPVWPVITGRISVENGNVADVRRTNVPPFDYVRQKPGEVSFRFEMREETAAQLKAFDFRVLPNAIDYCVTLEFFVDNVPRPGIVHLGTFMHTPEALPLRICVRSLSR